ncbi:unnamed protein product [Closterium sp. NIES-54]
MPKPRVWSSPAVKGKTYPLPKKRRPLKRILPLLLIAVVLATCYCYSLLISSEPPDSDQSERSISSGLDRDRGRIRGSGKGKIENTSYVAESLEDEWSGYGLGNHGLESTRTNATYGGAIGGVNSATRRVRLQGGWKERRQRTRALRMQLEARLQAEADEGEWGAGEGEAEGEGGDGSRRGEGKGGERGGRGGRGAAERGGKAGRGGDSLGALRSGMAKSRFAYVFIVHSSSLLRPAIVAAQALRFSRTPHDLLLLLSSSVPRQPSTLPLPLLLRHFTAVIPLPANHLQGAAVAANPLLVANPGGGGVAGWGGSGGGAGGAAGDGLGTNQGAGMAGGGSPVEGYRKLHVWRLVEYEWVLYLDVDVLITRNLDHLFPSNADNGSSTFSSNSSNSGGGGSSNSSSSGMSNKGAGRVEPADSPSPDTTSPHRQPCPEPLAAAPDVYEADRFNAGVLLVRPSLAVFRQIVRRAKVVAAAVAARAGAMPNDQSHPSCRLPFTTNAILHFPLPSYQPPSWLHHLTHPLPPLPPCPLSSCGLPSLLPFSASPPLRPHQQDFLNSVFRHWFQSHPSCRLPFTSNAILHFPLPWYQPPSWLHPPCGPDCAPLHLGPVHTVHFANPWFKPWLFLNTPLDQLIPGSQELGFKGAGNRVAAGSAASNAAAGAAGSAATGAATAVAAGSAAATTSNSSSCACGCATTPESSPHRSSSPSIPTHPLLSGPLPYLSEADRAWGFCSVWCRAWLALYWSLQQGEWAAPLGEGAHCGGQGQGQGEGKGMEGESGGMGEGKGERTAEGKSEGNGEGKGRLGRGLKGWAGEQ